jgi:uncharacterized membrane protein (UPF0136 family)
MLVLTTALSAGIITVIGARIDQLSTRSLHSLFPDFELTANKLMLQQAGVSIVHAITISVILLVFGGIL